MTQVAAQNLPTFGFKLFKGSLPLTDGKPKTEYIFRDNILPQLEGTPEMETRVKDFTVFYNPDSIDSMVATTLYISTLGFDQNVKLVPYHPWKQINPNTKTELVVLMGVHVPADDMVALMKSTSVQIFDYHGQRYAWVNKVKNLINKVELIEPCQEWYGQEQYAVDNTISNSVNQWQHSQNKPSKLYYIREVLRDIGFYFNFYHDKNNSTDIKKMVLMFNLKNCLESALLDNDPKEAIRKIKLNTDDKAFFNHLKKVRLFCENRKQEKLFRASVKKIADPAKYYSIPMVNCPEGLSHDVLRIIYQAKKVACTREDVNHYRITRVLCENKSVSMSLLKYLFPVQHWFEGEVMVVQSLIKDNNV